MKPHINRTVIMSSAQYFSNDAAINPYYPTEAFDASIAQQEHASIRDRFEQAGIQVVEVTAPEGAQDGVYTANWALIRGQKAVLARLPNARKIEEDWARVQLERLGLEVISVPGEWRFSGQGDALPCGNYLFCGSQYRSDVEAQKFVAQTLGYERIQLQTIPQLSTNGEAVINTSSGWADSFYYDIDLALAIIKPPTEDETGLIAYCPEAFTAESQDVLESLSSVNKIVVPVEEARYAFACNLVSTGRHVIMTPDAPVFSQRLRDHGLEILPVQANELVKGGGYIRCVSLAFND